MVSTEKSLNRRTFFAATWTITGYGFQQIVRLGSHLILARLFLPEDFGLVQLIFAFLFGLTMFSDLGLGSNVVQHNRGEDPAFLQTAWTLQILRGLVIWLGTVALAFPLAMIYQMEGILWLLPLAGIGAFFKGFTSMNLWIAQRRISLSRVTLLEIFCQFSGVAVMLFCAYKYRAVWALVIGSLFSSFIEAVLSHYIFAGPKMGLRWDREVVREIYHFGKWVFLSSFTTFLGSRLDLMIIGLFVSHRDLGLYAIASSIVLMVIDGLLMLSWKVLMPLYAHLKRGAFSAMKSKIFEVRGLMMLLFLPPFYILSVWGQEIISFVYPEVYRGAGWMIQMLAIGGAFKVVKRTIDPILIAMGDSYRMMLVQLYQALILCCFIYVGGHFFGLKGMIVAIVLTELIHYPVLVWNVRRYGVWMPFLDFVGFAVSAYFWV